MRPQDVLQLVFTNEKPLSSPALDSGLVDGSGRFAPARTLRLRALLRRVDGQAIQAEIASQLARFCALTGAEPRVIQGGQIAGLPVFREALERVLETWPFSRKPSVA